MAHRDADRDLDIWRAKQHLSSLKARATQARSMPYLMSFLKYDLKQIALLDDFDGLKVMVQEFQEVAKRLEEEVDAVLADVDVL